MADAKVVTAALVGALGTAALIPCVQHYLKLQEQARAGSNTSSKYDGEVKHQRAQIMGVAGKWTKPVVICSPGLVDMAATLQKRLGCEIYPIEAGETLALERFKSGDLNIRFNWQRVVGRQVVFLFDTVNQERLFEQLAVLQALQGFALPDSEDTINKFKNYVNAGKYSWGRAASVTVVLPWYRPCQMERTSRWHPDAEGKWTNSNPKGEWLDVPTALYLARLICTPGSVPPRPGPHESLDGMPIRPLWRPPLELLFLELHEEAPVKHAVTDLEAKVRMERFVPHFVKKIKTNPQYEYPGNDKMYVLCPDRGAFDRYATSVFASLGLEKSHVLYIQKKRVGDAIEQRPDLLFDNGGPEPDVKESFKTTDHVLIIDDFTNSGSTLFGAVALVRKMAGNSDAIKVSIFVSHLVATYDPKVVKGIGEKLLKLGPKCKFFTTNTIPSTTCMLRSNQITISGSSKKGANGTYVRESLEVYKNDATGSTVFFDGCWKISTKGETSGNEFDYKCYPADKLYQPLVGEDIKFKSDAGICMGKAGNPQVEIVDVSEFLADFVMGK